MVTSTRSPKIEQQEVATTTDTGDGWADTSPTAAQGQVELLEAFLRSAFPSEMDLTNRVHPETPAEVAIRLLTKLAALAPPQVLIRCSEPYCNQSDQHRGDHGWVTTG